MEAITDMQLAMTLIEEKGSQQLPSEEYNKVLETRQTAHGKHGEVWFLYILASIADICTHPTSWGGVS